MLTFSAIALTMPDRFELMPLDCSQYQNLSQCSTESTFGETKNSTNTNARKDRGLRQQAGTPYR